MKIKELLFLFFLFLTPNSDAMNNSTSGETNAVPDSDDELSFYCAEWPVVVDDEDILEALMIYICGLDPIAKAKALSRLKIFIAGLESRSIPEEDEISLHIGAFIPPQSLRFDN